MALAVRVSDGGTAAVVAAVANEPPADKKANVAVASEELAINSE